MDKAPDPITHVTVKAWRDRFLEMDRKLPEESAVALSYDRVTFAVMMASPQDLQDFAIGFSLSEGIIQSLGRYPELRAGGAAARPGMPDGAAAGPARGAGGAAPAHRRAGRLRAVRHGQPGRGVAAAETGERHDHRAGDQDRRGDPPPAGAASAEPRDPRGARRRLLHARRRCADRARGCRPP